MVFDEKSLKPGKFLLKGNPIKRLSFLKRVKALIELEQ